MLAILPRAARPAENKTDLHMGPFLAAQPGERCHSRALLSSLPRIEDRFENGMKSTDMMKSTSPEAAEPRG